MFRFVRQRFFYHTPRFRQFFAAQGQEICIVVQYARIFGVYFECKSEVGVAGIVIAGVVVI